MYEASVAHANFARLYGGGTPGAPTIICNRRGQPLQPRTLRIEVDWSSARQPGSGTPKHHRHVKSEAYFARPVRCTVAAGSFRALPSAIPLRDASIDRIDCADLFAYVKDDEGLAREIGRILTPGGTVHIRVPGTGPLAGLDAFNLQRYLVDTTRRGSRPPETAELGWRRHYQVQELLGMLGHDRFTIVKATRRGLALSELLTFGAIVLFRWFAPNEQRYRTLTRTFAAIARLENRIASPVGYWIELIARKTTSA